MSTFASTISSKSLAKVLKLTQSYLKVEGGQTFTLGVMLLKNRLEDAPLRPCAGNFSTFVGLWCGTFSCLPLGNRLKFVQWTLNIFQLSNYLINLNGFE